MGRALVWMAAIAAMGGDAAMAGLCDDCRDLDFTAELGRCVVCGQSTSSAAFTLCPDCGRELSQCESCRAQLGAHRPSEIL